MPRRKKPTCAQLDKLLKKNWNAGEYCAFERNYIAAQNRRPRACSWIGNSIWDGYFSEASERCWLKYRPGGRV